MNYFEHECENIVRSMRFFKSQKLSYKSFPGKGPTNIRSINFSRYNRNFNFLDLNDIAYVCAHFFSVDEQYIKRAWSTPDSSRASRVPQS